MVSSIFHQTRENFPTQFEVLLEREVGGFDVYYSVYIKLPIIYELLGYLNFSTVAGNDEYQFQLTLLPMANTRIVKSVSVVIHFPHNSTRDQGREIQLYVKCENLTAVQPIQFHTVNGTSKWIELGIKATRIPCSTTDECVFFVKISGDPSALETILIVYDYAKFGGFESDTLEKRSTDYIANKTLLTDLQANGINCSVNSVFLNYATELRIFDGTQEVISPNSIGINMTYCYGTCDLDYTLPANLTSAERVHFLHNLLQDVQHTPLLGACCVPDEIENDDLLISSMNGQVIELQTFPQVVSCKCMI